MDIIEFETFKLDLKIVIDREIAQCELTCAIMSAENFDKVLNDYANKNFALHIKNLKALKDKVSQLKINQI